MEPLVRLLVQACRMAAGDEGARAALLEAARSAPHVVLRAHALWSLRTAAAPPPIELFQHAIASDREVFHDFYLPAVSEAALGLARGAAVTEREALHSLVDAYLTLRNDDAPFALEAAIASWLDHTEATINQVWYPIYLARTAGEPG